MRSLKIKPPGTWRSVRTSVPMIRGARGLLAACLLLSVMVFNPVNPEPAQAAGRTFYVAKSGSDTTGDGSTSKPWATIQKAANSISGGDTVHVAAGTYNERVTIASTKSGTVSDATEFVADGAVVIAQGIDIRSSYTLVSGFEVTPGASSLSVGQVQIAGDHNTVTDLYVHNTTSGSAAVQFGAGAEYNVLDGFDLDTVYEDGIEFYRGYKQALSSGSLHNTARNGRVAHHTGHAGVQLDGQYNTVENVTISGPSGTASPTRDGDGIRVNGQFCTIRGSVIHDLWSSYVDAQHTDCIQWFTEDADGLLVEDCVLGTWQIGGWSQVRGATQIVMSGTEVAGVRDADMSVTFKNCVFMGEPQARNSGIPVAFNFNTTSQHYIDYYIYNCTFWDTRLMTSNDGRYRIHAYNNVFGRSLGFPSSATYMDYEGDYNFHCEVPQWNGHASEFGQERASVGGHSIMPSSGTLSPSWIDPDKTSASSYGLYADLSPATGSRLVGAGVGPAALSGVPVYDANGVSRSGATTDIGAFVTGSGPYDAEYQPPTQQDPTPPVTPPASPAALTIEDSAAGVTFDQFVPSASSAYSGGTYTYSRWSGTRIESRFTGTSIAWVGPKQPSYGKADVYIDDVYRATVDCYASDANKTISTTLWRSGELPAGTHTLSIRLNGAKNASSSEYVVVVDSFQVADAATTLQRVNETAGAFSGSWVSSSNSTYTNGSYRYSKWAGARISYKFTGTKVAWIGPRARNYGTAEVYIDGVKQATVSQYGALGWRYRVWESGTLTSGSHTIEIRVLGKKQSGSSGTVVVVDGFDVTP